LGRALIAATTAFEDADLVILHVIDPFDVYSVTEDAVWDDSFIEQREAETKELLGEYEALAAEHGATAEATLTYGSPSQAILGAAETVAERAPVSVTIVRPER